MKTSTSFEKMLMDGEEIGIFIHSSDEYTNCIVHQGYVYAFPSSRTLKRFLTLKNKGIQPSQAISLRAKDGIKVTSSVAESFRLGLLIPAK